MTERRERGWLPEGRSNPPRRGVLEDTLFRRLEEMRKKPPGELFELLERTLDVLRATKEALLEQRREIRSLATAVDTLRSRVDQLVQNRPEPRPSEPPPEPDSAYPEPAHEPEPEPAVEPELETELEPLPEPEPATEPEPEPDLLPAAEATPTDYAVEEPAPEHDEIVEDTAVEDSVAEEPAEPAFDFGRVDETGADQTVEHVLMLSTSAGYRIVIGDGAQPTPTIEVDGVVFQVAGRMGSPFPGDTRTAYFASRSDSAVAAGA
jgi:outer membrane biosynthesis protein TonB